MDPMQDTLKNLGFESLEQYISDKGAIYKFGGTDEREMLLEVCPFCGKDKYHFCINSETGQYYCHHGECNEKGNLITLAKHYGDKPYTNIQGEYNEEKLKLEKGKKEILRITAEYYQNLLSNDPLAEKYRLHLKDHYKLTPESICKFKLGVALGNTLLVEYLPTKGISLDDAVGAGVIVKPGPGYKDFFTYRIIFPFISASGEIAGLSGRQTDETPSFDWENCKYKHLKGEKCLYNEAALKHTDDILVVEGFTGCISAEQNGFHSVALAGVNLKDEWVSGFSKIKNIYVCLDGDDAGRKNAFEVAKKLSHKAKIITLPDGLDPNDYFKDHNADEFKAMLCDAKRAAYFESYLESIGKKLIYRKDNFDFEVEDIQEAGERLAATITLYIDDAIINKDNVNFSSSRSRNKLSKGLSWEMKAILEKELLQIEKQLKERHHQKNKDNEKPEEIIISEQDKEEAMEFLINPDIMAEIVRDITRLGHIGEDMNKKITYLIATSRKTDDPLSGIIKGQSSSGKSALLKHVVSLMPPEEVKDISRLTSKALFYMSEGNSLKHKFVVVRESSGSEDASYSIRSLISEKSLTTACPMKDPVTDELVTRDIIIEGPIAYMESTTKMDIEPETATRLFFLFTDESQELTEQITEAQRHAMTLEGMTGESNNEVIIRKHQNAQRLLAPIRIVIPYAELLSFPGEKMRARRDNMKFLNLIKIIAFIRQFQKESKIDRYGVKYIEADIADYGMAYDLAVEIFKQTLDALSPGSKKILQIAFEALEIRSDGNKTFSRKDLSGWNNMSSQALQPYMKQLKEEEIFIVVDGGKGKREELKINESVFKSIEEGGIDNLPLEGLISPKELAEKLDHKKP